MSHMDLTPTTVDPVRPPGVDDLEFTVTASDVPGLRRAMTYTLNHRADPVERAVALEVIASKAHTAQRDAISDRNVVAALLYHKHGVSLATLERALGIGARNRPAFREAIDANPNPPEVDDPHGRLQELTNLARDLHGVWVDATAEAAKAWAEAGKQPDPEVDLPLPSEPSARLPFLVEHLEAVEEQLAEVVAQRNAVAAALVEHWGWPRTSVARIAGTSESRLREVRPAPDDPHLDRRLVALSARARDLQRIERAVRAARKATAKATRRKLDRRVEGDLVDLPALRRRVAAAEKSGSPEQKRALLTELRALRRDVMHELRQVAVALHLQYDVPQLTLRQVMVPGARHAQSTIGEWLRKVQPPKTSEDEAWDLFRRRANESRELLELRRRLVGQDR